MPHPGAPPERATGSGSIATQQLPEGTVTVLFTDVGGSAELAARRGDEAARAALRAHEELVRQQVQEHGGREVKVSQ